MSQANSKNPQLTPETAAFIKALEAQNAPPLYTLTPDAAKQVLEGAQSKPVAKKDVEIQDVKWAVGPGGSNVDVRIVRPKGTSGKKLPVIFYIHGGGWVMGSRNSHDRLVRELVDGTGAAAVFVDFTNSPKAQYPVPLQQLYGALEYVAKNADSLHLDGSRIAVAGDSVGGNMSIAMTLMSKEKNGPKICFQLLIYPVTDAAFDTESYRQFADGPWLTKKAMEWFWDMYAPDKKSWNDIVVSPLRAGIDQLKGLPPAFVITDQNDVLRDEGEAYAYKLMQAGVKTASVRYNGTIHDFMMLDALRDTEPAKSAVALSCSVLKQALKS